MADVTALTVADRETLARYIPVDSRHYYDCIPYLLGTNLYPGLRAYKYVEGDCCLIYSIKGRSYYRLYKAYGPDRVRVQGMIWDLYLQCKTQASRMVVQNLSMEDWQELKQRAKASGIRVGGTKKLQEDVYNIDGITYLAGGRWARLRSMVNLFNRGGHEVKCEALSNKNRDDALALIKTWLVGARARKVVNPGYRQYSHVVQHHQATPNDLGYVYYVGGVPVSLQIANRVSRICFAHTCGFITDRGMKGLGEWTQHHLFSEIEAQGVSVVTDGLRTDSSIYKDKYNPVRPGPTWYKVQLPGDLGSSGPSELFEV